MKLSIVNRETFTVFGCVPTPLRNILTYRSEKFHMSSTRLSWLETNAHGPLLADRGVSLMVCFETAVSLFWFKGFRNSQ